MRMPALRVDQNGAVMERAHQEHRHRGHAFAVRLGADVGGDRHLADVELEPAHHAAERGDERLDLDEVEREGPRLDAAVLERLVVALRAGDGLSLVRCELGDRRHRVSSSHVPVRGRITPSSAPRPDAR